MQPKFILAFILLISVNANATLQPVQLTCEHLNNPIGIDVNNPILAWKLSSDARNSAQSVYEIILSDNLKDLQAGKGNVWETKMNSSQQQAIVWNETPLKSFTKYYWKVRVTDKEGKVSAWSEAWFETSMMAQTDWKSSWIGDGSKLPEKDEDYYKSDRMPLFRKEFSSSKQIASARLYISGLGYYEAYLNGKKISDHVLDPGWTTYEKQVLYVTHDVTSLVTKGKNIAGIMLGGGWWYPMPFKIFGRWDFRQYQQTGRPCVKAEIHLTYQDGTNEVIATDQSWMTAPGPVYKNSVYLGEHYDARMEQPNWNVSGKLSGDWKPATITEGPKGILTSQMQPPIRVTKIVKPVSVVQHGKDTFIVDMGQNFAGVVQLKVKGPAGKKITLRLGEGLFKDGSINLMTTVTTQIKKGGIKGGPGAPLTAWQEDSYTLKGGAVETWAPRFTFHGVQYVEVVGWPGKPTVNDFEGLRMNSDLQPQGTFSCSNDMFNKLHEVIQWTFLSNVFSVQSDCPGREKMGYGADMVVSAESFLYNYDMYNFYRKAVRDFANEQLADGGITEIAPFTGIADRGYGGDSGPMGWQLGFPFLVKQLYEFYGDQQLVGDYYDRLKFQIAFLKSKEINGLFHWDISDHEALDPKPEAFSASVFYYHHVKLAAEFAGIANKQADSIQFVKQANRIKRDIVSKYFLKGAGRFDNGTQSAQILGLWYHLSDEDNDQILKSLMAEFERNNMHLTTGIFSTKMMFDVLRENDMNETAYKIANQRDFPGWGHMLASGATTLWETWEFPETGPSRNHPMFGSVDEWFYRSLLGINSLAPGFAKIQIKPQPAGDLKWAKGSYESVRGTIKSDWEKQTSGFKLKVQIPTNTVAEVWVPVKEGGGVTVDGKKVEDVNDVKLLRREGRYAVVECGGGSWEFVGEM